MISQPAQSGSDAIGHPPSILPVVLIVDDDPQNLLALEAMLLNPDRTVITAPSGEEALKYLLDHDAAAVLLDVQMPGIDGYETAALIRARGRTRDVPILFLTSYSKEEADILRGYSYGAVDYIFKPVVPEILHSKVNVFVELYRKSEDLKRKNAELERAEKELIRSKAAASVIQHAPDPVFVSDVHGKILHANDAVSELLGLRSEELLEQSLAEFLSPEETRRFTEALQTVVKEGAKRDVKLHPKNSVGEITPTMLNASALRNAEGKVIGAIGILRDMTAHERLVRELEQSRASLLDKIKELQKFEDVVVGRELKMIALEKEVERLKSAARTKEGA